MDPPSHKDSSSSSSGAKSPKKSEGGSGTNKPCPIYDKFLFAYNHLIAFCSTYDNIDIRDQTDSSLEVRLTDLDRRWEKLQVIYEDLHLSPDFSNTRQSQENARVNFDNCAEAYYATRSKIIDILRISGIPNSENVTFRRISARRDPVENNTFIPDNSTVCIKVPPCDTEVFSGSYEQWPSFRDMFTAVYVNHPKLTPAQKLYHLRNKTKESAGAIVKRYPLCDENFEHAWNALKARFENKRVLVDNQLKILFNISPAKIEDSESLQKIHSTVKDCICTLKSLGIDVDGWDPILIYLVSTKLPDETISQWEQSLKSHRELPSWSQMDRFLINRFEVVERITSFRSTKESHNTPFRNASSSNKIQSYTSQEKLDSSCQMCDKRHHVRICPEFRKLSPQERIDFIFKNKMCNNCLSDAHTKAKCKSKYTCLTCKKQHHTLLHLDRQLSRPSTGTQVLRTASSSEMNNATRSDEGLSLNTETPSTSQESYSQIQANFSLNNETILLRTALVHLEHHGELFTVRALIDPGSQRTFLSERIRNLLKVPYRKSLFEISGVGESLQKADKECEVVLYSPKYDCRFSISAIILPRLTRKLPSVSFSVPYSQQLRDLDLADPHFNKSSNIDLILGNDSERFINLEGIKKDICGQASAYNTIFGWVLSGPIITQHVRIFTTNVVPSEDENISDVLRKFWEIEEVPSAPHSSDEDKFCQDYYSSTTSRDDDGRYVVRLPFKKEFPHTLSLGSSRFLALGQYLRLEKTLSTDLDLRQQYHSVLKEYISLKHMEQTSSTEICTEGKYFSFYLPHHAVVRPDHRSTKVRVVFNGSRKTKSGQSLNNVLYTGPTLQNDLMSIILNWRRYKYVYSADIEKMYRQIKVHPLDRPYQRILFENEPAGPIKDYQLNTVTFGINCAPFLAIRTLQQLASDSEDQFPIAAQILRTETYVDDVLSGGYSIEETVKAQKQLIAVLNSAGFPLKKFTTNNRELLAHLPSENLYDSDLFRLSEKCSTKTLGIKWDAIQDQFSYSPLPIQQDSNPTKRNVLSIVAQLFDPAGWITPVVIRSKILMQQIWLEGIDWDEPISPDTHSEWNNLLLDLPKIEDIVIPRWIRYTQNDKVDIHGFCDASKSAYCACVYIRVQTNPSQVFCNLLTAKSKVAPLKTVTLPKLELNGALLLAKLVNYVLQIFGSSYNSVTLWTDASIVLGWLSKPPMSWETYVENRTSQILTLVQPAKWRYVPTQDNPADLGTRGCSPQELISNSLWWNGPKWLSMPEYNWPKKNPLVVPEDTRKFQTFNVTCEYDDILLRFSSYTRALRVLSYVFRFFHSTHSRYKYSFGNRTIDLTLKELQLVKRRLLLLSQKKFYPDEYKALMNSEAISPKSSLSSLNPFLDSESILRSNGRLADSSLPYRERYPIILHGNSRLCQLYLQHLHNFLAHAECNLMCRFTQTEFYISRLKVRVKSIIHRCKTCIVHKHKSTSQIMAPLPPERCTISPPFHITGVDFAGPFDLKSSTLRNAPTTKGYVCVFVCFATKAVHLEACSDLSSPAFEAAFSRFVGRRGLPHKVVSDNGRNFLGASRALLREFSHFLKITSHDISQRYSIHGFEWKFIPPHAPHMGGLWEAAVKSFKIHFKKLAGSHRFNFEQFVTILARIEGVLNSRPISAISEDPTDLTALTPGHFLRGSPLMALPETISPNLSVINRWLKLKALHHQFAIRWKQDYLKALQKRYKWKNSLPNLKRGDLVIIMDDLLPPSEWRLGRIEKTYHGSDNNVRVADIRTAAGSMKRPISKLCYLPFLSSVEGNDAS
ncbi:uncharacterized protein LOC142224919 [Haematobia irritans]|uniref:uncharacterized protein LOC142224919 n=1 Tax=Haematobia irritans TaxID=7368 RepID=UPI003F5048F3